MATATDADAIAQSRAKRYIMLDIFNIAVGIDAEEKQGIPKLNRKAGGRLTRLGRCATPGYGPRATQERIRRRLQVRGRNRRKAKGRHEQTLRRV